MGSCHHLVVALGADDVGLLLLLSLFDEETSTLGFLLRDLLQLDGLREFLQAYEGRGM